LTAKTQEPATRRLYRDTPKRAGHKNISNTMIYTHVSDEQANESCREALMIAFG